MGGGRGGKDLVKDGMKEGQVRKEKAAAAGGGSSSSSSRGPQPHGRHQQQWRQ